MTSGAGESMLFGDALAGADGTFAVAAAVGLDEVFLDPTREGAVSAVRPLVVTAGLVGPPAVAPVRRPPAPPIGPPMRPPSGRPYAAPPPPNMFVPNGYPAPARPSRPAQYRPPTPPAQYLPAAYAPAAPPPRQTSSQFGPLRDQLRQQARADQQRTAARATRTQARNRARTTTKKSSGWSGLVGVLVFALIFLFSSGVLNKIIDAIRTLFHR